MTSMNWTPLKVNCPFSMTSISIFILVIPIDSIDSIAISSELSASHLPMAAMRSDS